MSPSGSNAIATEPSKSGVPVGASFAETVLRAPVVGLTAIRPPSPPNAR